MRRGSSSSDLRAEPVRRRGLRFAESDRPHGPPTGYRDDERVYWIALGAE